MRFPLRELWTVLTVTCFVIAALVRADALFECLLLSFTLLVLLASTVIAIGCVQERRLFHFTFVLIGACYLCLSHYPEESSTNSKRMLSIIGSAAPSPRHNGPELTTQLLRFALWKLHPGEFQNYYFGRGGGGGLFRVGDEGKDSPPVLLAASDMTPDLPTTLSEKIANPIMVTDRSVPFFRCGHCAWALLFGWLASTLDRQCVSDLVAYVDRNVRISGCDHSHRFSAAWARRTRRQLGRSAGRSRRQWGVL